ncbi:hypothetical protein GLOIN_2v1883277 [Rhizophagus irregularis DAOM 181602=DAOM 197198]|uniref:Crinkler effector protein N-terminal domain-containing protein n=1 Tax=Rhizophagus irregularis (strain DAOM 181602 / DAOM 197198 / MUCL 43194) TaxID=747089 RepID=A0A2P4P918_RHIID|nr:hypothetical protein GLOIN_2v1883277 [Rhizophagus irregularis DAOM 181602=DAOM 197198]POG61890.1 hypothetical protein GLOIN_2v1883277 [Rhizophagus irregularis DAOM 181602=DAOM 197198]GET55408.1 hypothetical protein GLOIN_2v1883277 [Rhizophagus irregularis DAOM 181602=DAOM 197198]|eukprot:XP_025168756.1 hypothetical protein GLOIN_2v1883277 [Rhizophagus irregularis DAOM 181602=DAOM 197198]
MSDDETDEGYNEFIKEYGSRYEWDNEGNPEFIPDLPSVRNSTSLFHVLLQSDVIYLPQILSLIELPYYSYELREEIWPDGIDKNEIKVDDNADEIKRCNDVIKLCKNHLRELFHKGLSSEKMLIQAEKENAPDFITAFSDCLRQTANAFAVDIDSGKLVSHLKDAIKAKKSPEFDNFPADKLKLWKVTIPGDQDNQLKNLILEDSDELLAIRKILKYFPDSPPEEHIHVIVSPPEATATSSREQELLKEVVSLRALINKSTYDFDVIVRPKQKANKWSINIEQASLKDLKDYIREMYKPLALENDGAVLNFMNGGDRYSPRTDPSFREMLRSLVSKNNPKFTVFIETPSKPFNSWTFPKVCELYGLSDDPNPSIDVYPVFQCGCANTKEKKYKEALRKLLMNWKLVSRQPPLTCPMRPQKASIPIPFSPQQLIHLKAK